MGRRSQLLLLLSAWLASGAACGTDTADNPGRGNAGEGGSGGSSHDASIEDGASGDGSIDEPSGGQGGTGSGGTGGESGTGDSGEGGGAAQSGTGDSGEGGESGQGGEDGGPDASFEGDAGQQDAVCFSGGDEREPSGSGACDSPIVIDMLELEYGDTVFHHTTSDTTNGLVPSIDKCAEGTGRDVVYNVKVPDEADLEVSVDATDGSDPIILVQNGPDAECDKATAMLCVDDTAADECEYLRIGVSQGGYEANTPQVVIAETESSAAPLTVRFRLIDPGSGS